VYKFLLTDTSTSIIVLLSSFLANET